MGDVLATRDDGSLGAVSELARHYRLAAPAIGPELGATESLRAAEAARAAMAYEQADAFLRHGLELVATMPAGADRDRQELQLQLHLGFLTYHTRTAALPEVTQAFDRAQTLCARSGFVSDHLRLLWGQYFMAYMAGGWRARPRSPTGSSTWAGAATTPAA